MSRSARNAAHVGKIYGQWTILQIEGVRAAGSNVYAWCRCACGAEHSRQLQAIVYGYSKSCGHATPRPARPPAEAPAVEVLPRTFAPIAPPSVIRRGEHMMFTFGNLLIATQGTRLLAVGIAVAGMHDVLFDRASPARTS